MTAALRSLSNRMGTLLGVSCLMVANFLVQGAMVRLDGRAYSEDDVESVDVVGERVEFSESGESGEDVIGAMCMSMWGAREVVVCLVVWLLKTFSICLSLFFLVFHILTSAL